MQNVERRAERWVRRVWRTGKRFAIGTLRLKNASGLNEKDSIRFLRNGGKGKKNREGDS